MNSRRATETRLLLKLSAPVAVSQLALVGMGVTDVLVAGRAGTDQLAGMMLGANMWHLVAYFFFGIGLAAQPLVGHAFGAGNLDRVRTVFQSAFLAALATSAVAIVAILLAASAFSWLDYEPALGQIGQTYVRIMALGAPAICLLPVLRSTLEAIGQTAPVTRILVFGFLLNIPLDMLLVFGPGPFPGYGAAGCAAASVTILWLNLAMMIFLARSRKNRHLKLFPLSGYPDKSVLREYFRLGLPIGFTITAELSFFVVAALLVAFFGPVAASAHSVAISTASVAFMFYMGLGQGIAIRASQLVGAGRFGDAAYTVRTGVQLTFVLALIFSSLLLLFRFQLPWLFSTDSDVAALAAGLLVWAAIFQLVDALQCVGMHGLRAYRDTLSPIFFQTFSFWVLAFPCGFWLARNPLSPLIGPGGYWAGMTLGLTIAASLIGWQLRRRMRSYGRAG